MNKVQFIDVMVGNLNSEKAVEERGKKVTKKLVTEIVDELLDSLVEVTAQGEGVNFPGVLATSVKETKARTAINPKMLTELKKQGVDAEIARQQATVPVPAGRKVSVSPKKYLKQAVKA